MHFYYKLNHWLEEVLISCLAQTFRLYQRG